MFVCFSFCRILVPDMNCIVADIFLKNSEILLVSIIAENTFYSIILGFYVHFCENCDDGNTLVELLIP